MNETKNFNPARYIVGVTYNENREPEGYLPVQARVAWYQTYCIENGIAPCISSEPVSMTVLDNNTYLATAAAMVYMNGTLVAKGSAGIVLSSANDDEIQRLNTLAIGRALSLAGFGSMNVSEEEMGRFYPCDAGITYRRNEDGIFQKQINGVSETKTDIPSETAVALHVNKPANPLINASKHNPHSVDPIREKTETQQEESAEKNKENTETQSSMPLQKTDLPELINEAQKKVNPYTFDEVLDYVMPVGDFRGMPVRNVLATVSNEDEEKVFDKLSYYASRQFDVQIPEGDSTLEERIFFKTVMIRVKKIIDSYRRENQMMMLDSKVPIGDFRGRTIREMLGQYPEGTDAMNYFSSREFNERKAISDNPDVKPMDIMNFKIRMFRINGFFTLDDAGKERS